MRRHCSPASMSYPPAFLLLLLLLLSVASSRFRFVVEAASTPPTHVSVGAGGGGGEAAEAAAMTAGRRSSESGIFARPTFDVDEALAAARARAAAGSGAPLSPAAAATAGRTAMANACGPGLGRCSLARGGCCSERGTCGWECRGGACQEAFSAPGFCRAGDSVSSTPPPPASSLPLVALGWPCGAYVARCGGRGGGGGRGGEKRNGSSCCSVLGFCVSAPSPLCSGSQGNGGLGGGLGGEDGDGGRFPRTTRRFRLVATRGDVGLSAPAPPRAGGVLVNGRGPPRAPLSLSASAGDRVVVEFVNALDEASGLHFHGVRWLDRGNEDGAAGVAQRAVAAGGGGGGGEEGGGGGGGGEEDDRDGGGDGGGDGAAPLPPPVFVYDFVARDRGTFWWHSHVRAQAADGLRGTLVVRGEERGGEEEQEEGGGGGGAAAAAAVGGGGGGGARAAQRLSRQSRSRRQPEATLFVSDWYGAPAGEGLEAYLSERNLNGREPTPDALAINGRSWHWSGGGSDGGGGGASPSSPPPPSFEVSDPRGDPRRRSLARCSEPRDRHALVRLVNGGAFATVAVSFFEAAEEAEAKPKPAPSLRATVVSADAVPTVPAVLDLTRPLRLGVGQRHDVELCALESESGGSGDSDGEEGGGGENREATKIASVWAVAVADGALFDAPMRLSNATAAVLRLGGGGRDSRRLLPPAGIDLSDAGAAAAAPPAFSSSSTSPPVAVPSPRPTVSHRLTISFNKQKKKGSSSVEEGGGGGASEEAGGKEREGKEEDTATGPRYFVEGFSQRPRGLDDPRQPSLLETEKKKKKAMLPSSSSGGSNSSSSSKEEGEEEEEPKKEWNLLRHPLGSVVEMRVRNDDDVEHSWHLHGHNFWVVKSSSGGEEAEEEGKGAEKEGTVETTAIIEARDTVLVPAGARITARYVVDSPGAFLAHCHMSWHEAAGLAVVMVDGVD